MKVFLLILTLFCAISFLNGCKTPAARSSSGGVVVRTPESTISVVFSDNDRRIIGDYFARFRGKKLPPGLAKRDTLPPGLARQVVKNGSLPPGLQGRVLPLDLETQLSKLPDGHERAVIGADIIILNTASRVVTDIIVGVVVP